MKPVNFKYANTVLEKPETWTDEQCGPLPIFRDDAQCISLWSMSLRERLSALFFGRVWVFVYSGLTQPPINLSAKRNIFKEAEWRSG